MSNVPPPGPYGGASNPCRDASNRRRRVAILIDMPVLYASAPTTAITRSSVLASTVWNGIAPGELVVRRAHSAVPRLHLLGRGLRMAWTNSALPNCTTRTYLAAA
jgi:hypothetical protein